MFSTTKFRLRNFASFSVCLICIQLATVDYGNAFDCQPNLRAEFLYFMKQAKESCNYQNPNEICKDLEKNGDKPTCISKDHWNKHLECLRIAIAAQDFSKEIQRFFFSVFFSITKENQCKQWTTEINQALPTDCTPNVIANLYMFEQNVRKVCHFQTAQEFCSQLARNNRPDCIPKTGWDFYVTCIGTAAGANDWRDELQRVFHSIMFNNTFPC